MHVPNAPPFELRQTHVLRLSHLSDALLLFTSPVAFFLGVSSVCSTPPLPPPRGHHKNVKQIVTESLIFYVIIRSEHIIYQLILHRDLIVHINQYIHRLQVLPD